MPLVWRTLVVLFFWSPFASAEDLVTPRERAAHLLSASLQLKWAAWVQRYPTVAPMDIVSCGADCWRINGVPTVLSRPTEALDRLPDVRVIGLVRDSTRPLLLLRTRGPDPIHLWAAFAVYERRLKFIGYDKVENDLPGDDLGDSGALVTELASDLELYKFLTTRSASNLNVLRDEIAVRLGCDFEYLKRKESEVERLKSRLPASVGLTARVVEMQALITTNRRSFLDGGVHGDATYCEPKRTRMWRDHLLELRVLTEYAITNVALSEFGPESQRSSSSR